MEFPKNKEELISFINISETIEDKLLDIALKFDTNDGGRLIYCMLSSYKIVNDEIHITIRGMYGDYPEYVTTEIPVEYLFMSNDEIDIIVKMKNEEALLKAEQLRRKVQAEKRRKQLEKARAKEEKDRSEYLRLKAKYESIDQ